MDGAAVMILGCGDAFHLVPRILNYFIDADFTTALGVGKLVTSITMTVFYVIVYHIGCSCYLILVFTFYRATVKKTAFRIEQ